MKYVKPSYEILSNLNGLGQAIELAGRLCYKSEDKITNLSYLRFCEMLIQRGHEAMLEHAPNISVKFIANRGFMSEITRHRLSSFAAESTRYCDYSKDKFGNELTFCLPNYISMEVIDKYMNTCSILEEEYLSLIKAGVSPQIARDILPIGVKAEIIVTANVREWRHILRLRTANGAHPIMHELMRPLLEELQVKVPVLFGDIDWEV